MSRKPMGRSRPFVMLTSTVVHLIFPHPHLFANYFLASSDIDYWHIHTTLVI